MADKTEIPSHGNSEVAEKFVQEFVEFGREPTPEAYEELFHEDGTILDAGMSEPQPKSAVADSLRSYLNNIPDFKVEVVKYYTRDNLIYMLADNTGTFRGESIKFRAVYSPLLKDGKILRGRRFYDQAKLLAPLVKDLPVFGEYEPTWTEEVASAPARGTGNKVDPEEFVNDYAQTWRDFDVDSFAVKMANFYNPDGGILNPGMEKPIIKAQIPGYYHLIRGAAPDLTCELQNWAGDGDSLCIEWVFRSENWGGQQLSFRVADVFEFEGRGIKLGCAYFDTLTLIGATDPRVDDARAEFARSGR